MATRTNKRLTRTIPPLRGPNSQVPPVKFSKGMTKGGLRIRKFKGGGADMGDPGRAQERADRGYGDTSGVDRSAVSGTSTYGRNVMNQNIADVNKGSGLGDGLKTAANFVVGRVLDVPSMAIGAVRGITDKFSNITRSKTQTANQIADPYSKNSLNEKKEGNVLCADGTQPPCTTAGMVNGGEIRVRGSRSAIRGTGFKGVF